MTIEHAQYITQLDKTQPGSKSDIGEDDDHLRLIRTVLKTSFPEFDGAIQLTPEQINEAPNKTEDLNQKKASLDTEKSDGIKAANDKKTELLGFDWSDLNLEQDLPTGEFYALFYDAGGAYTLTKEWVKCDGTGGTEDLTSKAIELLGGSQSKALPISHFTGLYVVKYIGG